MSCEERNPLVVVETRLDGPDSSEREGKERLTETQSVGDGSGNAHDAAKSTSDEQARKGLRITS